MAELLQFLKEVQAYLTSQQKVLKRAGSLAACMDQQATAWEARLKTAKITAPEEDLLQVLAKGPWNAFVNARAYGRSAHRGGEINQPGRCP